MYELAQTFRTADALLGVEPDVLGEKILALALRDHQTKTRACSTSIDLIQELWPFALLPGHSLRSPKAGGLRLILLLALHGHGSKGKDFLYQHPTLTGRMAGGCLAAVPVGMRKMSISVVVQRRFHFQRNCCIREF